MIIVDENHDSPFARRLRLSVVIPHYNQVDTLVDVLADLEAQENVQLEVIVVDDASQTSCSHIVALAQQREVNVRLIEQQEKVGTLACRLAGMKAATGDYLTFIDADDRLNGNNSYAAVFNHMRDDNADIIHFNTLQKDEWDNYGASAYMAPISRHPLKGAAIFSTWVNNGCAAHTVWNKFYSRRLYKAVADVPHELKIQRIEDFYLTAWFFFLARSYAPVSPAIYKYNPPKGKFLEKSAARALDCLRMYLRLPDIFAAQGLPEDDRTSLKKFLRLLITINGAKMCEMMVTNNEDWPELDMDALRRVLPYGSREELFLVLAIVNASNSRKLRDIAHIIRYSW